MQKIFLQMLQTPARTPHTSSGSLEIVLWRRWRQISFVLGDVGPFRGGFRQFSENFFFSKIPNFCCFNTVFTVFGKKKFFQKKKIKKPKFRGAYFLKSQKKFCPARFCPIEVISDDLKSWERTVKRN